MANVSLDEIKQLVSNQMGTGSVNDTDRIVEDLGAESSDVANIIAAVEDRYGIQVPEGAIKNITTVRDVYMAVQNA
jgi:acyl carrier protein